MSQVSGAVPEHEELIRQGQVGSFLNLVGAEACNRYQHLARKGSRLGIPLLLGRDVIHGFRTTIETWSSRQNPDSSTSGLEAVRRMGCKPRLR